MMILKIHKGNQAEDKMPLITTLSWIYQKRETSSLHQC